MWRNRISLTPLNFVFLSSFSLTVEDELEEFDLQCPVHSSDDHVNVTYSLQRGSNPVVSWMIGDEDVASGMLEYYCRVEYDI